MDADEETPDGKFHRDAKLNGVMEIFGINNYPGIDKLTVITFYELRRVYIEE